MNILVYAASEHLSDAQDAVTGKFEPDDNVSYREPRYFDKCEPCDLVVVHEDWPAVVEAYESADPPIEVISTEAKPPAKKKGKKRGKKKGG